jgi:hypothetical protein
MIKLSGKRLLAIDRFFFLSHLILENILFHTPKKNKGSDKIVVLKFLGLGSLILFARLCEQHEIEKSKITLVTFERHKEFCYLFGFNTALFIRTSTLRIFLADCIRVIVNVKRIRPSIIIDYERASYSIGTFRNLLALFCKAKTISFQVGRAKDGQGQIIYDVTGLTYEEVFMKGISVMDKKSGLKRSQHSISPTRKILININASDYLLARRYPLKSFAKALHSIYKSSSDLQFYLTGTLSERNYIDELQKEIPECNVINTAGDWSLEKLADEIARCAFFITCDSGPLHLAAYFETPTIVIWGPTQPQHFGYKNQKSFHHISLNLNCSPCFTHPHSKTGRACNDRIDCLTNLDPQRIADAAISLLNNPPAERLIKSFENKISVVNNTSTPPLVTHSETI